MMKNAMDAIQDVIGERKGHIHITAKPEGKFAAISIRDNGKGMERATLNRLFDPFFTTKEAGTGLGFVGKLPGSSSTTGGRSRWTAKSAKAPNSRFVCHMSNKRLESG